MFVLNSVNESLREVYSRYFFSFNATNYLEFPLHMRKNKLLYQALREAMILSCLKHNNIVTFLGVSREPQIFHVVYVYNLSTARFLYLLISVLIAFLSFFGTLFLLPHRFIIQFLIFFILEIDFHLS